MASVTSAQQRTRFAALAAEEGARLASPAWPVSAALQNRRRNRYLNVLPWDKTRVRLDSPADYINASWVEVCGRTYIAAQGPLASTAAHFWAMCFSEAQRRGCDTVAVCMVTPLVESGVEKCARYWPAAGQQWDFGPQLARDSVAPRNLTLTWEGVQAAAAGVEVTQMRLALAAGEKRVVHYAYLGWRDTLVPESPAPLLALSGALAQLRAAEPALVPVVHCSAGVGRTGTFIALDAWAQTSPQTALAPLSPRDCPVPDSPDWPDDPVYQTVRRLRACRMMMVQTVHQYMWLYGVAEMLSK